MAIINLSAGNFLAIFQSQTGLPNNTSEVISQSITISQSVRCSKQFIVSNQSLALSQAVGLIKKLNLSLTNTLVPRQTMGPTKYLAASNVLVLTQSAANVNPQIADNVLVLTQTVSPSRALSNSLTITQTVARVITVAKATVSTLTVTSSVSYFKTDAVNTYNITVPDPVAPTPIILTCGSESITLKIPEIGDADRIELSRVQEITRGGDLIIFADPRWPKTETLKYQFKGLTRTLSGQLLNFLKDSLGLSVTLVDYQGQSWQGIITTPEAERISTNDNNCGSYDIEIEFQGVKI